jgi:autotransporter-associated beta strand protein
MAIEMNGAMMKQMSFSQFLRRLSRRAALLPLAAGLWLLAGRETTGAATIASGNVTTALGPTFFVDDAVTGGTDTTVTQPAVAAYNRSFAGLLSTNQGPTRITLTGFGFASSAATNSNTATTLTVSLTYLGADGAVGGGDDVFIGSATGTYVYSGAGEYVFAFDTPLTVNLSITGVRFLIQVTPANGGGNGAVLFKTAALTYETGTGPKFSVAGVATPLRLNLAKYQPVITDSTNGQRLASYVTDGVVGNDNSWQSGNTKPHWAQVSFPFPVQVGSAQIFSGVDDGSALTGFTLQYLTNTAWVNVPGGTVSGNTNVENNLVFTAPVTAAAFRLYDSADKTVNLKELALYPPNGSGGYPVGADVTLDLAHERPAVATANTAGNFARNAVDGYVDDSAMWQTTLVGSNALMIDLRVNTKIGSAHLYSGSPGVPPLANFVLRYWNGSAWQDIPGGGVSGNTAPALVIPFASGVTTSNVLLIFTNSAVSSVEELAIFPANNNGGYPIGTGVIGALPSPAHFDDYNDAFYNLSNPAANLFVADSNGVPVLNPPGLTAAQGQYQVLLNLSTGTYRLCNRATGNCLSGAQLSTNAGALLVDEPYAALPDQDWILQSIDGTNFYLVNQWSGLVADTQGGGPAPGTPLVQNVNTGAASQRWQMINATNFPKKGLGGTGKLPDMNANWVYNWGLSTTANVPAGVVFDPMQWGSYNWSASTANPSIWKLYSLWRTTAGALHLLGFNEPDNATQSNIDPTNAAVLWPRLQVMDVPLAGPACANVNGTWNPIFFGYVTNWGLRVDYLPAHEYVSPSGGNSSCWINPLQTAYNTYGLPMWMTEFGNVDWAGNQSWTEEDNYNALAEFLWRAESVSWLRKYALFVFTADTNNPIAPNPWTATTPAPRSNAYDTNNNLTPFGELYAAWDDDANVETNKNYFIHNSGTRKRLQNTLAPSLPGATDIRNDGPSVEWTLQPSATAGQYNVVSVSDGRLLSYVSGGSVSLVAPGTTGPAVQWALTPYQYGWFYLDNPAAGKRLQLAYNNSTGASTFSMVATTTTSTAVQWRFIVPLPPAAWTGASSTSWNTAGNWSPSGVPATGYGVQFNSFSTAHLATVLNQNFNISGVTLTTPSGPVSIGGANSLTLDGGGIDLSGASQNLTITAPLVLGTAQSWNVAGGQTLSVNGGVSGSSALTILGAGTVSLSGPGTYSGDTTINDGGTLKMGAANVLPTGASAGNLVANGTLDLNGFSEAINGLSGSGVVDITGGGTSVLTVGNNDAVSSFSGTIQNTSGTLALVGAGTNNLTLAGANTFSGGFTNNGTGSVYPLNNAAFGTGPVVANAGKIYSTSGSFTYANALILNGGTLEVGGGNNHVLTWTGPVTLTADALVHADGGTGGITLSGSVINAGFTLSSRGDGGVANTISGPISGAGGNLTVTSGTLILSGANTCTGNTTVSAGKLTLSGSGSIGSSANIIVAGGATLDVSARSPAFVLGATQTLSNSAAGAVINGANNCSSGTLSLVYDGANPSFFQTNGTMTLSGSTVVRVNNTGPQLTVGTTSTIIAAATTGNPGGVAGVLPPVTVTGNGNSGTATLQINNTGGLDLVVVSSMASDPTNLSYTVSGGTLTLTWPGDHLGWIAQSNSVSLANTNDWFDITGSQSGTNLVIPISPAQSKVFYRLRYPN